MEEWLEAIVVEWQALWAAHVKKPRGEREGTVDITEVGTRQEQAQALQVCRLVVDGADDEVRGVDAVELNDESFQVGGMVFDWADGYVKGCSDDPSKVLVAAVIERLCREDAPKRFHAMYYLLVDIGWHWSWEMLLVDSFVDSDRLGQIKAFELVLNSLNSDSSDGSLLQRQASIIGSILEHSGMDLPDAVIHRVAKLSDLIFLDLDSIQLLEEPIMSRILPELCESYFSLLPRDFLLSIVERKFDGAAPEASLRFFVKIFNSCREEEAAKQKLLFPIAEKEECWTLIRFGLQQPFDSLLHKQGLFLLDTALSLGSIVEKRWLLLSNFTHKLMQMEITQLKSTWEILPSLLGVAGSKKETGNNKKKARPPQPDVLPVFSPPFSFDASWIEPCLVFAFLHPNPEFRAAAVHSYLQIMENRDVMTKNLCSPFCLTQSLLTIGNVSKLVKGGESHALLLSGFLSKWLATVFASDPFVAGATLRTLFEQATQQLSIPAHLNSGMLVLDVLCSLEKKNLLPFNLDKRVLLPIVESFSICEHLCEDSVFETIFPRTVQKVDQFLSLLGPGEPPLDLSLIGSYIQLNLRFTQDIGKVSWDSELLESALCNYLENSLDEFTELDFREQKKIASLWIVLDSEPRKTSVLLAWCRNWAKNSHSLAKAQYLLGWLSELIYLLGHYPSMQVSREAYRSCERQQNLHSELITWFRDNCHSINPKVAFHFAKALALILNAENQDINEDLKDALVENYLLNDNLDWTLIGTYSELLRGPKLREAVKSSFSSALHQISVPQLSLMGTLLSSGDVDSHTCLKLAMAVFETYTLPEGELILINALALARCAIENWPRNLPWDSVGTILGDILLLSKRAIDSDTAAGFQFALHSVDLLFSPKVCEQSSQFVLEVALPVFSKWFPLSVLAVETLLFKSILSHFPEETDRWTSFILDTLLWEMKTPSVRHFEPSLGFCLAPDVHCRILALRFVQEWNGKNYGWLLTLAEEMLKHIHAHSDLRTPALQAVCVILQKASVFTEEERVYIYDQLVGHDFESFKEESLNRYYLELAVSSLILINPERMVPKLMQELRSFSLHVEKEVSLIPIVGSLVLALEKFRPDYLAVHETLFDDIMVTLLPYTGSTSVVGREVAQWVLHRFYKMKEAKAETIDSRVESLGRFLEHSNISKRSRKRISDRLEQYIPSERCKIKYLFQEEVKNHPFYEWLLDWFPNGFDSLAHTKLVQNSQGVNSKSDTYPAIDIPWIRNPRKFGAIVLGSLVYKVPNAAGLTRTCDLLSMNELVLGRNFVNERDFPSIACSSESWMPTRIVPSVDLPEYIAHHKTLGYQIIALEQSANSVCITKFQFPSNGRVVFLLGTEKEGIASHLLRLVDKCIEIPQFGVTRSLNVHASCSLLLWEYVKQQQRLCIQ